MIVKVAAGFQSIVRIACKGEEMNAKSLIGLMMLPIIPGDIIEIIADGDDEDLAVSAMDELFTRGFDETTISDYRKHKSILLKKYRKAKVSFGRDSPKTEEILAEWETFLMQIFGEDEAQRISRVSFFSKKTMRMPRGW